MARLAAIATWVLLRTPFGNWIFGVGGRFQAARNVGVPVSRVKILLFMGTARRRLAGGDDPGRSVHRAPTSCAGRTASSHASSPPSIGGTLLTGGYGTVDRRRLRRADLGMVNQGIVFAGFDADWFQVFLGAMLLAAVLVNRFIRQRATGERS